MIRSLTAVALTAVASGAAAAPTDFGVRLVPGSSGAPRSVVVMPHRAMTVPPTAPTISAAVGIASSYGRVTSTYRSPAHNRRVGGAANSYHIRGRAIDVVPRPGITHAQIEAAYRRAGFQIIESLDEGDHSHFAFGYGPGRYAGPPKISASPVASTEITRWRVVSAPRLSSR